GAEQSDPREGRSAPLDRPHHDQLGPGFGRVRVHPGADQLHYSAVFAGARRGRLLPWHDPLFHLLVPAVAPRAHRRRLHGSDPGVDRARRPRFDRVPRTRWGPWTCRLEMAVSWRGGPSGPLRGDLLLLL